MRHHCDILSLINVYLILIGKQEERQARRATMILEWHQHFGITRPHIKQDFDLGEQALKRLYKRYSNLISELHTTK